MSARKVLSLAISGFIHILLFALFSLAVITMLVSVQAYLHAGEDASVYLPLVSKPFLPITRLVSVASDETQGNSLSAWPSISLDGRYVAFESMASNLVSSDTNDSVDIFVRDWQTGETVRVSVSSDGAQANSWSSRPSISADGRYVAFVSGANNLVSDDTNNTEDIFVHDRQTGETMRLSVASDGAEGDAPSIQPSISGDGRQVAFASWASNLVSGDSNGLWDVFVHDRLAGVTTRVSVASDGAEVSAGSHQNAISAGGRSVAFESAAPELTSGDTNNRRDVFVRELPAGPTMRISVASDGGVGNADSFEPTISADGRYLAFTSIASNLVSDDTNGTGDVFLLDRGPQ